MPIAFASPLVLFLDLSFPFTTSISSDFASTFFQVSSTLFLRFCTMPSDTDPYALDSDYESVEEPASFGKAGLLGKALDTVKKNLSKDPSAAKDSPDDSKSKSKSKSKTQRKPPPKSSPSLPGLDFSKTNVNGLSSAYTRAQRSALEANKKEKVQTAATEALPSSFHISSVLLQDDNQGTDFLAANHSFTQCLTDLVDRLKTYCMDEVFLLYDVSDAGDLLSIDVVSNLLVAYTGLDLDQVKRNSKMFFEHGDLVRSENLRWSTMWRATFHLAIYGMIW